MLPGIYRGNVKECACHSVHFDQTVLDYYYSPIRNLSCIICNSYCSKIKGLNQILIPHEPSIVCLAAETFPNQSNIAKENHKCSCIGFNSISYFSQKPIPKTLNGSISTKSQGKYCNVKWVSLAFTILNAC